MSVFVDEKELPMVRAVDLGPVDVDLHRDRGRHRIGADDAPSSPEDVELPIGDLGGVTEKHRHSHADKITLSHRSARRHASAPLRPVTVGQVDELGLRNDVYRRPLVTALERLRPRPGWRCVDVGAGQGDVSLALASLLGPTGRVYAVDSDPRACAETAKRAAARKGAQVVALTQAAEDLTLPEKVELAYCRFLLMHVRDPARVVRAMAGVLAPGGYLLCQEPITSAGRIDNVPFSMPSAAQPDVGAFLPSLVRDAGLRIVDAWAESQAGIGPGEVADYLATLTEVAPENEAIILPPLVTVIGQSDARGSPPR